MKTRQIVFFSASLILLFFIGCTKDNKEANDTQKSILDTLNVHHEMKGYEIYSWPEGNNWYFSVLAGTNRTKTYSEVTSANPSAGHLITVSGLNSLKLVLGRFPENEYITLIGKGWLQSCWSENYGNLQLPPQNYIVEISQLCSEKKLNLQVTD